jgi:hypothetical protein
MASMVGWHSTHAEVEDRVTAIPIQSKGSGLDHLITSIPLIWLTMHAAIQRSSNDVEKSRKLYNNPVLPGSLFTSCDALSRYLHASRMM